MKFTLRVAAGLAAFSAAAAANAQTLQPVKIVCIAVQFDEQRHWGTGRIVYRSPVHTIIDKGNWVNDLAISWHKELESRGFVLSKYATGPCVDPVPENLQGVEIAWSPPAIYLAQAKPAPKKQVNSAANSGPKGPEKPSRPVNPRAESDAKWKAQLAEYEAKLAEQKRQVEAHEQALRDLAARQAANKAAAEAAQARHQAELAEHARQAAEKRAEWAMRAAGLNEKKPEDEVVLFKEGVVLCKELGGGSNSFSCHGPLQNVSTPLDAPSTMAALGMACGSDRSIRDLGMTSGYRAFGCGFGMHPTAGDYPGNRDVPAKLGVDYVPGRGVFSCPKSTLAYCRG